MSKMVTFQNFPAEILLKILRAHFANLRINARHPATEHKPPRSQSFLQILRSCRRLHRIGYQTFLEEAQFHFVKYEDTSFHVTYPPSYAQQFGHISGTLDLASRSLKPGRLLQHSFPNLKSVTIKEKLDTNRYAVPDNSKPNPHHETGTLVLTDADLTRDLEKIRRLQQHYQEHGIAFDVYLTIIRRPSDAPEETLWMSLSLPNADRFLMLTQQEIKIAIRRNRAGTALCQVVATEEPFFDLVKTFFDRVFGGELENPGWPPAVSHKLDYEPPGREWQE